MKNKIKIENINFEKNSLPLIAGPCVIESRDHVLKMAESISKITQSLKIPFVFKSSVDKANRTSVDSFRGVGIEKGLGILSEVKSTFGIPVLTDIHHPEQAPEFSEVADILQIPAFLCRQTDLLIAAGETQRTVNVKKGQFLAPWKMESIVKKIESTGNTNILLTERGTTFGYESLVSDVRTISMMQTYGHPVIFDATHSAQIPGIVGNVTGGMRKYIPVLAKAAVASGCDGLFLEVHDDVSNAKSDASTQFPLDKLESLLIELKRIHQAVQ